MAKDDLELLRIADEVSEQYDTALEQLIILKLRVLTHFKVVFSLFIAYMDYLVVSKFIEVYEADMSKWRYGFNICVKRI